MNKLLLRFWLMPMLLVSVMSMITSCSSDNDEEPVSGISSSIIGVWKGDSKSYSDNDFVKFSEGNVISYYEIINNGKTVLSMRGYYTFDASSGLMILHYDANKPNADADVYLVTELNDSRLSYMWIDDISDEYTTSSYSQQVDLGIIAKYANSIKNIPIDADDVEYYYRSSDSALQNVLDAADRIENE